MKKRLISMILSCGLLLTALPMMQCLFRQEVKHLMCRQWPS